ncbi:hypothetical protein VB713_18110 [Anabaena cylindrica UHCC 0172]|uniref:hypothetical protein n=1 Tax=Anabaena cylindrica TaxID=1165 RepID=UPI002B1F125A|nr:hypothetical protein [Anabaena cylindrica]MEA5552861.1 hypothetical protein [Anabaena cylindrica UHCC 0172]
MKQEELIKETAQSSDSITPERQTRYVINNLISPSLLNFVDGITSQIPQTEWEQLPSDLSKNLDHYLYSSPKIEE